MEQEKQEEVIFDEYIGDEGILEKNIIETEEGQENIIEVKCENGDSYYMRTYTEAMFNLIVSFEKKDFSYVSDKQQGLFNDEFDKLVQKYNISLPTLKYIFIKYGDAYENKLNALISKKIQGDDRFYVPSQSVQDFTTYVDFRD